MTKINLIFIYFEPPLNGHDSAYGIG